MTERVTTYAEAAAFLAISVGISWLIGQVYGPAWALIVWGAVILCTSAVIHALARWRGGSE